MEIQDYIESGVLEQFIAGNLSEAENEAIIDMMKNHPEVTKEVLDIEHAILTLTKGLAYNASPSFDSLWHKINVETKVVPLHKSSNWKNYMGWAAAILVGGGLLWSLNTNRELEQKITNLKTNQQNLEIELNAKSVLLVENKTKLAETNVILDVLRDKNTITVPLAGQAVYPEAYANAYWDKKNETLYLDLSGLPKPPKRKVYQIWSLTLNPLTPTDLGVVDNFEAVDNKIFKFANAYASQAFGITLEPKGGSASPTLEQLYTLGVVKS